MARKEQPDTAPAVEATAPAPTADEPSAVTTTVIEAVESDEIRIKYDGPTVHRRIISSEDTKSAGFELSKDLVWEPDNRHIVSIPSGNEPLVKFLTENASLQDGKGKPLFRVLELGEI